MDDDITQRIKILLDLENEAHDKAVKRSAREIAQLEKQYDPLSRAVIKLEQEERKLARALEKGTIDQGRHNQLLRQAQDQYRKTEAAIESANAAIARQQVQVRGLGAAFQRNRGAVQQLGYQVGDFAVQVQGGTSAVTAFTQQGSQMLGAFGPMGAVLGAVLAVGVPLAAALWNAADASEEAKEKAKSFSDILNDTKAAIASSGDAATLASAEGYENLSEMFGTVSEKVRELARELASIEKRAATLSLGKLIDTSLGDQFKAEIEAVIGDFGSSFLWAGEAEAQARIDHMTRLIADAEADIATRQRAGQGMFVTEGEIELLAQMREELAALQGDVAGIGSLADRLGMDPEALILLNDAMTRLEDARAAQNFGDIADAISDIRETLQSAGVEMSDGVLDNLTLAEAEARKFAHQLEISDNAVEGIGATDIASGIAAGVDEAVRLAEYMGIALGLAQRIERMGPQGLPRAPGKVYSGRGGDPRNMGGSSLDWQVRQADDFLANWTPPKPGRGGRGRGGRGGGGRGGGATFDPLDAGRDQAEKLRQQIQLIGETEARTAALTAQWSLLSAAKKKGIDLDRVQGETGETVRQQIERQAAAIGDLTQQYDQAKDRAEFFEQAQDSLQDGFLDAIVSGKDLGGVLEDLARSFARAALEASLFGTGPFAGGSGGGGGLLGGLFKGVFGGFRAEGGGVSAGKSYVVGERGPELFTPASAGAITPNHQMGGTGGVVMGEIGVTVDDDGKLQAYVKRMGVQAAQRGAVSAVNTVRRNFGSYQQEMSASGGMV
ncbi:hypothetical protein [Oceaniglobus trochenteri]|uniref:hypothetical protein n=1 Tax=Oceaniglobus trochenteri TaxID=2763260 RepID=UPI001CFFC542|nr:hypothetical protein [Oceaniglobus trochenteri]